MERLKEDLFRKGGEETDWQLILNEGLRLEDHVWYEAAESGDPIPRRGSAKVLGSVECWNTGAMMPGGDLKVKP